MRDTWAGKEVRYALGVSSEHNDREDIEFRALGNMSGARGNCGRNVESGIRR
jgi:hypothetical protein